MVHEILSRVTPLEITVSLISYCILHGLILLAKNIEKFAADEYHRVIIEHTRHGHRSKFTICTEDKCATKETAQELQQLLPELPA